MGPKTTVLFPRDGASSLRIPSSVLGIKRNHSLRRQACIRADRLSPSSPRATGRADQIDKQSLEIAQATDETYADLRDLADELPDHSPRYILLSYPLTLVREPIFLFLYHLLFLLVFLFPFPFPLCPFHLSFPLHSALLLPLPDSKEKSPSPTSCFSQPS